MSDRVNESAQLLAWLIEQSATDKGEMAYLAEQAIEEATDDLAEAILNA